MKRKAKLVSKTTIAVRSSRAIAQKRRRPVSSDPYARLDPSHLAPEQRAKLDAAISRGLAELDAGKGIPAELVLQELDEL